MYGHPRAPVHRFVWILDGSPEQTTEVDRELWRRYVELRGELETTLEGLGMLRNWLDAKLREIDYERDELVSIFGWEMINALSHVETTANHIRELPGKHLVE
jgi:hypothetical protein